MKTSYENNLITLKVLHLSLALKKYNLGFQLI